jgi:hypothetical protein
MGREKTAQAHQLFVSPREYFQEIVGEAFESRKITTFPLVKGYLVDLLEFYVPAENLFDDVDSLGRRTRETLAETYLKAHAADPAMRTELLKRLADRSLYISGFFSDSLQRKLIDVDYYAEMGCAAYGSLAESVREDTLSKLYREFASRFLDFVDVLTHISSRAAVQNEQNILRLYETYSRTGSDLAREKLLEKGLIAVPIQTHKKQQ